jgi:hypothetical protein
MSESNSPIVTIGVLATNSGDDEDNITMRAEIKKNYDYYGILMSENEQGIAGEKQSGVRNFRSKRSTARKRYFVP